ncbi:MAG: integration host factor subunit beta [Calditrichaeota bacterium]|nr:MAG: integration host factor subunit beta [Calditrichota bacterium]MBL1204489.1 integration host factor subunit beta [Calditrichota bacterium]NOG44318.1 integration host factor subunit beta [Calditrichota bacterium]
MRTVTKKDVAKRTALELNNSLGENIKIYTAEKFVDAVFSSLRKILSEADPEVRIEIRDFGVFEVKKTKPKPKARNPRTGEIIYVPARRKTHFKAGKILKDELKKETFEGEPNVAE